MKKLFHPLMHNNFSKEDINSVIMFLKQNKNVILTQSKKVSEFEKKWSEWLGTKYSVFVNSGSSANLITLQALKLIYGNGEIIVPTLTWISDISSVLQNNFKPIFVDINPKTLSMNEDQVIKKINRKTKAVFISHIQGFNGLSSKLLNFLKKKKVILIEDVCESHGAKFKNKKLGTYGLASNFSFYYAHHMSTIEGGMISTNDKKFYETARILRSHGMLREAGNKKFEQIQKTPGVLFNAMLNPFVGYGIKGFLWYQGEANRHNYNIYEEIVNKMVTSWRNKWNEDDLPFYFAQIAPFNYGKMNSAFLREAQLKISNSLKNAEIVVTIDVGDCSEIHPSKKIEVGKRLAYIALAKDYGFVGFDYSSPKLKDWIVRDNEIVLEFSSRVFIKNKTQPSKNFEIAGPDKIFYPAEATLSNVYGEVQQIIISSDKVSSPIALRYGFKNCVTPNLFGRNGLPVSSFRTDNF